MSNKPRLLLLGLLMVLAVVWFMPFTAINAASSDELQSQIDQRNQELAKTSKQLQQANAQLKALDNQLRKANSELPRLELEIAKLRAQIVFNKIKLDLLDQSTNLVGLEEEKMSHIQGQLIKSLYTEWRLDADINRFLPTDGAVSFSKRQYYQTKLLTRQSNSLEEVRAQLAELGAQYEDYDQQTKDLLGMNQELELQRKQLQIEVLALKNSYGQAGATVAGLQSKQDSINEVIASLSVAQQQAAAREADILEKKPPKIVITSSKTTTSKTSSAVAGASTTSSAAATTTATSSAVASTSATSVSTSKTSSAASTATSSATSSSSVPGFALRSVGRDYYQGHGVGLSQWGSHGMAKAGLKFNEILARYYQGTSVTPGYEQKEITLKTGTKLNIEAYVAGLGEIPSKACGTEEQVAAKPAKYIKDNPNSIWDCWPEESIKAQVVAARSYALYYNQTRGALCTSATCQVYQGGTAKKWAADETKGQVVTFNGQPIEALYSSDNNQGNGTANNDTIFQNFKGVGNPYPYLRAFNDNANATRTSWTTWSCTTNKYTYGHIQKMFRYIVDRSSVAASTKKNVQTLLSQVGTVTSMSFERDPSQRVAKVVIKGTAGSSTIGGWWFKSLWNEWVYSTNRTSTNCFGDVSYDYIYSQTLQLLPR